MSGTNGLLREGDLTGESYTAKAKRNLKNCSSMYDPPEPLSTYVCWSDRCVISVGGVEYRSRKDPRYGAVIDLPCRWANTHFRPGNRIPINDKGDWMEIQLLGAPGVLGTF
jgi:hypothetical protein